MSDFPLKIKVYICKNCASYYKVKYDSKDDVALISSSLDGGYNNKCYCSVSFAPRDPNYPLTPCLRVIGEFMIFDSEDPYYRLFYDKTNK